MSPVSDCLSFSVSVGKCVQIKIHINQNTNYLVSPSVSDVTVSVSQFG